MHEAGLSKKGGRKTLERILRMSHYRLRDSAGETTWEVFVKSIMVLGFLLCASTANAYTDEQARLCTNDAFRLCGDKIPDIDAITVCMRAQKKQLSDGCKTVFDQPATVQPVSNSTTTRIH